MRRAMISCKSVAEGKPFVGTAASHYGSRWLQVKRCGELGRMALLALACCLAAAAGALAAREPAPVCPQPCRLAVMSKLLIIN